MSNTHLDNLIAPLIEQAQECLASTQKRTAELLHSFEAMPSTLEADHLGPAITLAKQTKMQADAVTAAREQALAAVKAAEARIRALFEQSVQELDAARVTTLHRIRRRMEAEGRQQATDDYGTKAYFRLGRAKLRIVNMQAVPREYLTLNEQAVKAALKDNKPVPGIEVDQDMTLVVS